MGKLLVDAALVAVLGAGCRQGVVLPVCPAGETLMGAPPPKGQEVWCQKIVNGKPVKDGPFILYADGGGKLIEGNYRDGLQDGEWTTWYENGQRSAVDHYRHGLQDGLHTSWYANGRKSIEGDYRAGERVGVWTRWDPSGVTSKQETYADGEPIR
jgi:antitoxin component YwqK of YwqJK toxin-antitoxin module